MINSKTYTKTTWSPLLDSDNTNTMFAQQDVPPVKPPLLKCVSLVPNTDPDHHTVHVTLDSMRMVPPVLHVEWNAKPVITLIPVLLVLVTELNQKKVVLAHTCIMTLVKISAHHVQMLVPNVIWMVTVLFVELTPNQYQIVLVKLIILLTCIKVKKFVKFVMLDVMIATVYSTFV